MAKHSKSNPDATIVTRGTDEMPEIPTGTQLDPEPPGHDLPEPTLEFQPTLSGVFGNYRVEEMVGEGAMGQVYRALDTRLDRVVALKIPTRDDVAGDRQLKRFYREARSAANLHHPNICTVYDVGEVDGTHYIAMQFIEGRSLAEIIAFDGPLDPQWAGTVIRKLASALQIAHDAGIVHRDIKPANIIIGSDDEPVVMDFGLARQFDDVEASRVTQEGMIIGSPAYMSPEQMADREIGPPTDIYSLGVVLYEMLCGKTPFSGTVLGIASQILNDHPPPIDTYHSGVPVELEAICRTAMEKSPDNRFRSMNDMAGVLDAYLRRDSIDQTLALRLPIALSSVTGLMSPVTATSTTPTRSRLWMPAAAVAALVGIVAIVGVIATSSDEPSDTPDATTNSKIAADSNASDQQTVVSIEQPASPNNDNKQSTSPTDTAKAKESEILDTMLGILGDARPPGAPAVAPARAIQVRRATGDEPFSTWDDDNDGFIDDSELMRHIVDRGDANRDGVVSKLEFDRAIERFGRDFYTPPTRGPGSFNQGDRLPPRNLPPFNR